MDFMESLEKWEGEHRRLGHLVYSKFGDKKELCMYVWAQKCGGGHVPQCPPGSAASTPVVSDILLIFKRLIKRSESILLSSPVKPNNN